MNRQIVKGLFKVTKHGNSGHIILPNTWIGEEVEILVSTIDDKGNKDEQVFIKIPRRFGKNGAHVFISKRYIGTDASVTMKKFLSKQYST